MDKLDEDIEFYEMTEADPELLVMLLELRRHRQDNWKQRAEEAEAQLAELANQKAAGFVNAPGKAKLFYHGESLPVDTKLYTRAVPALPPEPVAENNNNLRKEYVKSEKPYSD